MCEYSQIIHYLRCVTQLRTSHSAWRVMSTVLHAKNLRYLVFKFEMGL